MFRSEPEPDTNLSNPSSHLRFIFDSRAHRQYHLDTQRRCSVLQDRITELVNEATVNGQPLIKWIFQAIPSPDAAELKFMGEVLVRISELLPAYYEAKDILGFINYAVTHPNETMLAFADASSIADDFAQVLPGSDEDK